MENASLFIPLSYSVAPKNYVDKFNYIWAGFKCFSIKFILYKISKSIFLQLFHPTQLIFDKISRKKQSGQVSLEILIFTNVKTELSKQLKKIIRLM